MEWENRCSGCERNCCINFKITLELTDPDKLSQILGRYRFIQQISRDVVYWRGREKVVGVYKCKRFNEKTGECKDYFTQERPDFCKNTGGNFIPSKECKFAFISF